MTTLQDLTEDEALIHGLTLKDPHGGLWKVIGIQRNPTLILHRIGDTVPPFSRSNNNVAVGCPWAASWKVVS